MSQTDPWIWSFDVKPLLEIMTTQNNGYNSDRFQLCSMSPGKRIVGRQIFVLSVSCAVIVRIVTDFQGIRNGRDTRRQPRIQISKIQIFKKKIICDWPTFLFCLFHNIFFLLRNYFPHGGQGITWGILLLPSHVVDTWLNRASKWLNLYFIHPTRGNL